MSTTSLSCTRSPTAKRCMGSATPRTAPLSTAVVFFSVPRWRRCPRARMARTPSSRRQRLPWTRMRTRAASCTSSTWSTAMATASRPRRRRPRHHHHHRRPRLRRPRHRRPRRHLLCLRLAHTAQHLLVVVTPPTPLSLSSILTRQCRCRRPCLPRYQLPRCHPWRPPRLEGTPHRAHRARRRPRLRTCLRLCHHRSHRLHRRACRRCHLTHHRCRWRPRRQAATRRLRPRRHHLHRNHRWRRPRRRRRYRWTFGNAT